MTPALATAGPHADEGALMRLIDSECTATERAQLATHLETCGQCRRRRDDLTALTRGVSEALARSDAPPRAFVLARRSPTPAALKRWWPAAAAIVLLAGGTIAVAAPVRTWMVAGWIGLRELLHAPGGHPSAQIPVRDQSPAGMVSFVPDAGVLTVRVATRQAEGLLVFEKSRAPVASVTVRGQGDREAVVVLPDELRIANMAASRATYRVTLPTRLTGVMVVIGADRPVSLAPLAPGDSIIIDLSASVRR